MSVEIKQSGVAVIHPAYKLDWEEVNNRVNAIIWAIQCINQDMMDAEQMYYLTAVLNDYLPSEEQWKKIFE
ncbi:MAG: hypothetical protein M9916_02045 [Crocinitomicaceae bacterium]|nr:hypothetical protein [Crocinitomicaceae bacterium]